MASGAGGTGGLQTSALAIGLSWAATAYLEKEAAQRPDLRVAAAGLRKECESVEGDLLSLSAGQGECTPISVRAQANSLALRATQAALSAAKGTGFIAGHPVGRWCREALFFLVWSCPQPVMAANLCEFAGLSDA
jgi:alkylation response protein AidB-like acyl-CoA dehydrogenase